ncbi:MAG: hypothetical protein NUV80_06470 [Candidatus Berkelbacteria bacterium]|nr:hypothetical protein [Candidatus Berkelbacteria bacterium]
MGIYSYTDRENEMIVEKQDTEELEEFSFINPDLPGNKFLSITFTADDRTEFLGSSWKKVTSFEDACKKYLLLIV